MTLQEQAASLLKRFVEAHSSDDHIDKWYEMLPEAQALVAKLAKKPEPPTEAEIDQFNQFRQAYSKGGTVNGCMVEMKNFQRHKDWREIIPVLMENLIRQRKERAAMADAGEFVPSWRNLKTYINNRGWETVHYHIPAKSSELPPKYIEFLRQYITPTRPLTDIINFALTNAQFQAFAQGVGPFAGIEKQWSSEAKREKFVELHRRFFTDPLVRSKSGSVFNLIKSSL